MEGGVGEEVVRPRARRVRAPPPPSATGATVLLTLWGLACVLMLFVGLSDDRSARLAGSPPSKSEGEQEQHVAVFSPVVEYMAPAGDVEESGEATFTLVETMPVGDFNLSSTAPETFDALLKRVQTATETIDISAMYWNLLGKDDRKVFSDKEMREFGADRGEDLFIALHDAAARGVTLRLLTAKESVGETDVESANLPDEVQKLVNAFPSRVLVRCWSGPEWYGSGILHQKIWLFDRRHLYVGSANMDWKSLSQVMEVGVLIENLTPASPVIQDLGKLFDAWWMWADPNIKMGTSTYYSEAYQLELQVPSWSIYLPSEHRRPDPFVAAGLSALGNISHQLQVAVKATNESDDTSHANLFIAAAPMEATAAHSRTFDEESLVYTINSAKSRVSLSVMDFTPYSMYTPGPIWWPALTDAILAGLYSKPGLHIRLLISQWQYTKPQMLTALKLLGQQGALCKTMRATCSGTLEIRLFRVPGWNDTVSTSEHKSRWPGHSRVNHAKYIVTDTRVNVGTSNMEWGYFYTTAGASVNTDHEGTRRAFENLFDRNWNSEYAHPMEV